MPDVAIDTPTAEGERCSLLGPAHPWKERPLTKPTVFGTGTMTFRMDCPVAADGDALYVAGKQSKSVVMVSWRAVLWAMRPALEASPSMRAFVRAMLDEIERVA